MTHATAARLVVWGAWAALTVGSLAMIARFGSNVPYLDEWDMVPTLTGEQPVTLEWLWSQHNEHRVPLPRLLQLALHSVTIDFRIPMVFDVLATALLAAALVLAVQREQGGPRVTDAVLPVVMLHPGHAINVLWGWEVQFYASMLLSGVALLAVVRAGRSLAPARAAAVVAVAAALLPLCGGNGVALVPPLAAWAGWVAWRRRHEARVDARVALGAGGLALALTGLYFVGYEPVPYHPRNWGILGKLVAASKVVTVGLGPGVRELWPAVGIVAFGLLATAGALVVRAARRPDEQVRAGGLAAVAVALGVLAGAIGLSRDGFEARYVTLIMPLWCATYAALALYGAGRLGVAARGALAALAVVLLWPNTTAGLAHARDLRAALGGVEQSAADGVPIDRIVARHAAYLHPHHDVPTEYFPMLRRAGVPEFRDLRDAERLREVPVPLTPVSVRDATWTGRTAQAGARAQLVFALPDPVHARGIRLRYRHSNPRGTVPYVSLYWRGPAEQTFTKERFWKYSATGDRANWERCAWTRLQDDASTMTVWLDAPIAELRLQPDFAPGTFEVLELVVLCAETPYATTSAAALGE